MTSMNGLRAFAALCRAPRVLSAVSAPCELFGNSSMWRSARRVATRRQEIKSVDELPLLYSGKINRRALKQRLYMF